MVGQQANALAQSFPVAQVPTIAELIGRQAAAERAAASSTTPEIQVSREATLLPPTQPVPEPLITYTANPTRVNRDAVLVEAPHWYSRDVLYPTVMPGVAAGGMLYVSMAMRTILNGARQQGNYLNAVLGVMTDATYRSRVVEMPLAPAIAAAVFVGGLASKDSRVEVPSWLNRWVSPDVYARRWGEAGIAAAAAMSLVVLANPYIGVLKPLNLLTDSRARALAASKVAAEVSGLWSSPVAAAQAQGAAQQAQGASSAISGALSSGTETLSGWFETVKAAVLSIPGIAEAIRYEYLSNRAATIISELVRNIGITASSTASGGRRVMAGLTTAAWASLAVVPHYAYVYLVLRGFQFGEVLVAFNYGDATSEDIFRAAMGHPSREAETQISRLPGVGALTRSGLQTAGIGSWLSSVWGLAAAAATPTTLVGGLGTVALTAILGPAAIPLQSVAVAVAGGIGAGVLVHTLVRKREGGVTIAAPSAQVASGSGSQISQVGRPIYDTQTLLHANEKLTQIANITRNCETALQGMCKALLVITVGIQDMDSRLQVKASDFSDIIKNLVSTEGNGAFSKVHCDEYLQGICTRFTTEPPAVTGGSVMGALNKFSDELVARIMADAMLPCVLCTAVLVQVKTCLADRVGFLVNTLKFAVKAPPNVHLQDTLARVLLFARLALALGIAVRNVLMQGEIPAASSHDVRESDARNGGFGFATYLQSLLAIKTRSGPGADDPRFALLNLWTKPYGPPIEFHVNQILDTTILPEVYFALVTTTENILKDIREQLYKVVTTGLSVLVPTAVWSASESTDNPDPAATETAANVVCLAYKYAERLGVVEGDLRDKCKRHAGSVVGDALNVTPAFTKISQAMEWYTDTFVSTAITSTRFWTDPSVKVLPHVSGQPPETGRAVRKCNIRNAVGVLADNPAWHIAGVPLRQLFGILTTRQRMFLHQPRIYNYNGTETPEQMGLMQLLYTAETANAWTDDGVDVGPEPSTPQRSPITPPPPELSKQNVQPTVPSGAAQQSVLSVSQAILNQVNTRRG